MNAVPWRLPAGELEGHADDFGGFANRFLADV